MIAEIVGGIIALAMVWVLVYFLYRMTKDIFDE